MSRFAILLLPALLGAATVEDIVLSDGRQVRGELQPDGSVIAVYGTVRAPLDLKGATITSHRSADPENERKPIDREAQAKVRERAKPFDLKTEVEKFDTARYPALEPLPTDTDAFRKGNPDEKAKIIEQNKHAGLIYRYNKLMEGIEVNRQGMKDGTALMGPVNIQAKSYQEFWPLYEELHHKPWPGSDRIDDKAATAAQAK